MADPNHAETEQALKDLNTKICAAEKDGDADYLASVLADGLVFRRAGGAHVNKEQYLDALRDPANTYEYIHCDDVEVIPVDRDTAFVSLLVWAKGMRGTAGFKGIYR